MSFPDAFYPETTTHPQALTVWERATSLTPDDPLLHELMVSRP